MVALEQEMLRTKADGKSLVKLTTCARARIVVPKGVYIHRTAKVGKGTKIGAFCDVGKGVFIGENCNVQCHVMLSNGTIIGDNVFIGPNAAILNDKYMNGNIEPAKIGEGAKIGGGSVILPGISVGKKSANWCWFRCHKRR